MGREYPLGYTYFRDRLHRAFASKAHLSDEQQIQDAIRRAEFVRKGKFSGHPIATDRPLIDVWQKSKHCTLMKTSGMISHRGC